MTNPRKKKMIKHIAKQAKIAPKRLAKEMEALAKTKVKWI